MLNIYYIKFIVWHPCGNRHIGSAVRLIEITWLHSQLALALALDAPVHGAEYFVGLADALSMVLN